MTGDHLDDVLLSASLDGESTSAVLTHLEACETCRARRAELGRAATVIGTPVVRIDGARREAAIVAALGRSPLVERRRRRTFAIPAWSWAAAAVVLALVVVLPLVARSPGRDDEDMAASEATDDPATLRAGAGDAAATAGPTPIDAGDMGVLDDTTLRDRVNAHLTGEEAAPLAGSDTGGASGPACEPSVRAQDPSLGVLRLFGRATIDGQAVELLVFDVPDAEPLTLRAYALAAGDCTRIVRFVSFAAS